MTDPSSSTRRRKRGGLSILSDLPPKVLWRFALLLALGIGAALLIFFTPLRQELTQEKVVAFFDQIRLSWWAPILLLITHLGVSLVGLPVSPVLVGGGVAFGALLGSIYNIAGLFLGAATSFYLAKFLGREFIEHLAGERLKQVERAFERSGFWPLVQARFLPIPFSVINYGAALAGARPSLFLLASAIGLTPSTVMHTFFTATLFRSASEERLRWLVLYLLCWGALALVTGWPTIRQAWRKRRQKKSER